VEKIRDRTEKSNTEETALPTWRKVCCLRVQKYPGLFWEEMTGIREKHDIRHIPLLLWKYFIKIIHQTRRMQERGPATQNKTEEAILFFDGECALCNGAVQFILRREKKPVLRFATLQGETAKEFLAQSILGERIPKSLVLIHKGKILTESDAVLGVCGYLGGAWPLMRTGLVLPLFLRNGLYRFIASRRYRWFGKTKECMLMKGSYKARFLA
jgi:predicted DCC family thiol-disulfide oxidoreductase YuxK